LLPLQHFSFSFLSFGILIRLHSMITVYTKGPSILLGLIKGSIDKGHITTWSYDSDGDFTHTPPQWKGKAWLSPSIENGVLLFSIISQNGIPLTTEYYAVYHGRFIEMLLAHFDKLFTSASATAIPTSSDRL